ncbi:MAG: LysR family transcriptional regulator [Burkholderiales bacterium]|nr:LysR family transcriptional regulator [Burkholderiales bacterium]
MSSPLTLRQLRAFVAVAQHGRFALAAQSLHLTQSALSMLVRQLEGALAVRVFDRHTRMVQLTAAGREFLPVAQKTLADLDAAQKSARDLATHRRGRVSVATNVVVSATIMPSAIRQFVAEYPGIEVVLRDVPEQHIRASVRERSVDFGIGTVNESEADLVETPLFRDRLTLICAVDHPLTARRSVRWRELASHPTIVLAASNPLRALADAALARAGVRLQPAYEVSFSSTAISLAAAGLGVATLPVNARQLSAALPVAVRELVAPTVRREVAIFHLREYTPTPATTVFAEFLVRHCAAQSRAAGMAVVDA